MSCVFFFKQKTAYEMRISDWSSDVCSSDLCLPSSLLRLRFQPAPHVAAKHLAQFRHVIGVIFAQAAAQIIGQRGIADRPGELAASGLEPAVLTPRFRKMLHRTEPPSKREIGRASCRERVCPAV